MSWCFLIMFCMLGKVVRHRGTFLKLNNVPAAVIGGLLGCTVWNLTALVSDGPTPA